MENISDELQIPRIGYKINKIGYFVQDAGAPWSYYLAI
jgi:hypothetical protein